MLTDFRERGMEEEKEGEKHQCERETLIGCLSYRPQPGTKPATQVCAVIGNQTGDLSAYQRMLPPTGQHCPGRFSGNLLTGNFESFVN